MRAPNNQTEQIDAPFHSGTAASSNTDITTTSTTHATSAFRANWAGKWVRVSAVTSNVWFLTGITSSLEVDRTVVTATVKLGSPIPVGTYQDFWIRRDATHYSVEADAAGTCVLLLTNPAGTNA